MKTSLLQRIRNYILPSNTGRSLGAGLVNCGIAAVILAAGSLTSCKEEIDESNLYTFTGETIEDYLANRSDQYSSFNQILTRIGYDKILAAYGKYTCFAPNNEAIAAYQQAMPGYTIVPIMQSNYTPWLSTDALHCRRGAGETGAAAQAE